MSQAGWSKVLFEEGETLCYIMHSYLFSSIGWICCDLYTYIWAQLVYIICYTIYAIIFERKWWGWMRLILPLIWTWSELLINEWFDLIINCTKHMAHLNTYVDPPLSHYFKSITSNIASIYDIPLDYRKHLTF